MTLELISRGSRSTRPPLLFMHGGFHSASCWDAHFLPWFADRGWETHALSLRGHGNSPGDVLTEKPGLDDYVDDIGWALGEIGRPVVMLGHSMGGLLTQMARARYKQVEGAVLIASSPLRPAPSVALRILRKAPVAFARSQLFHDMRRGRAAFETFFYAEDLPPERRAAYAATLCHESPRALSEIFSRDVPETPDLETRPVLVVAGRDDWSIPMKDHEWLAATFKAPLKVCKGPHNLMLEPHWQETAATIDAWLHSRFVAPADEIGVSRGG